MGSRGAHAWRRLPVAIAVAVAMSVPMAAAGASIDPYFPPGGLTLTAQDDRLESVGLAGNALEQRLDLIDALGVTITRVDVHWNQIAPAEPANATNHTDPAYVWQRYDRIFNGLRAREIVPVANVFFAPSWANGGRSREWAPDPDDYAAFMTALATRYNGQGGRPRVPVFEPWNEANMSFFLRPQWVEAAQGETPVVTRGGVGYVPASPAIYAELLARAYDAITAVQPDAAVVGLTSGTAGTNAAPDPAAGTFGAVGFSTFVAGVAAARPPMDAVAIHLYPAREPVSQALLSFGPRLQTEVFPALEALGEDLPVLVTEFGWRTLPTVNTPGVTEDEQARFLDEAVRIMATEPRFRSGTWFNLQDNPDWPAGLRRGDGTAKPSWAVFQGIPRFIAPGDPWLVSPAPPPPAPIPVPVAPEPRPAPPAGATAAALAHDVTGPIVRVLRVPSRILSGRALPARVGARAGTFALRVSEPGRVTILVQRRTRAGYRTAGRAISFATGAGTLGVRFAGRFTRRTAVPDGVYRLRVFATDAAGNRSRDAFSRPFAIRSGG